MSISLFLVTKVFPTRTRTHELTISPPIRFDMRNIRFISTHCTSMIPIYCVLLYFSLPSEPKGKVNIPSYIIINAIQYGY